MLLCQIGLLPAGTKCKANYFAIRFPLGLHQESASVDICSGAHLRMPHELLLDTNRSPRRVQPSAVRMAKSVLPRAFHTELFCSGTNVVLLN